MIHIFQEQVGGTVGVYFQALHKERHELTVHFQKEHIQFQRPVVIKFKKKLHLSLQTPGSANVPNIKTIGQLHRTMDQNIYMQKTAPKNTSRSGLTLFCVRNDYSSVFGSSAAGASSAAAASVAGATSSAAGASSASGASSAGGVFFA